MRTAFALLFLLALVALPLSAGGPPGERPMPGLGGPRFDDERIERFTERHAERLTRALDLSADQQATLERLQNELTAALQPLFEQVRSGRESMEAMLEAATPDATAIGRQAIAQHRLHGEMRAAHEHFKSELTAMLNPTQRAQFEALEDARPERGRGRHGGHGWGAAPPPAGD